MAVSIGVLKKHVRAEDFSDDDELLGVYLNAAKEAVIKATCRTEEELTQGVHSLSSLISLSLTLPVTGTTPVRALQLLTCTRCPILTRL